MRPIAAAAIVFMTPFSGCFIRAKSEFCSMFSMMIEPKMKGAVTPVRNDIGSVPNRPTPIHIASAAPPSAITLQTSPSTGCFITAGDVVSGHRSKHKTKNITASAVTWNTSAMIALNMPCGAEAIVVIENEFNKGGIENYEAFDGYLLDQIVELHRVSGLRTIVAFGNWGLSNWARFDRAAAASDFVGTQLLRSSVRDAATRAPLAESLRPGRPRRASSVGSTDNAAWRSAITGVKVDGAALTGGQYVVTAGHLKFTGGVFTTTGSHTVAVRVARDPKRQHRAVRIK